MKKLFVLFIAAVMMLVMCACGSSPDTGSADTDSTAQEEQSSEMAAALEQAGPEYKEMAEYYEFELDGKDYSLPCPVSDFSDNGWYIDPEDLNFELETDCISSVFVYTDSSMDTMAFSLILFNTGKETKAGADCYAGAIKLESGNACTSLTLKKAGVTVDVSSAETAKQSLDLLTEAYGTDEDAYSNYDDDDVFDSRWSLSYKVAGKTLAALGREETSIQIPKGDNGRTLEFELENYGPEPQE